MPATLTVVKYSSPRHLSIENTGDRTGISHDTSTSNLAPLRKQCDLRTNSRQARDAILSTTKFATVKPKVTSSRDRKYKNYLTDHRQVDATNREAMIRMRTIEAELSRLRLTHKPR